MDRSAKFPEPLVLAAQHAERTTGCPTCVSLAQWALESAYGTALAAANNPFGMKWSAACGYPKGPPVYTKEYVNGRYITVTDYFIAFPSIEVAFNAHGHYMMGPNAWGEYQQAAAVWRQRGDWKGFIERMAPRYATDPQYAALLIQIVNDWHLFDFNLPRK